jgi:hypothetical protein
MEDYRCKLITRILFATSQNEVKRYIGIAMKGLQDLKVNAVVIARLIEMMIQCLDEFNAMNYDAQQCTNIKMATTQFN